MPRQPSVRVEIADTLELLEILTDPLAPSDPPRPSVDAARQPGVMPPAEAEPEPPDEEAPDEEAPDPNEEAPEPPDEEAPDEEAPDEEAPEPPGRELPADPPASAADRVDAYRGNFTVLEGELTPPPKPGPDATRYASRIEILEAWQYPGALRDAPRWVDRNWTAYDTEHDPLREILPGPCLKVPLHTNPENKVVCRVGDYIALQQVQVDLGLVDTRIEVWARENFQKLFMPRPSRS